MNSRIVDRIVILAVGIAILTAGGIGIAVGSVAAHEQPETSMEVTFTVDSDGQSGSVDVRLVLDDGAYDDLSRIATSDGYDSVAEWYAATLVDEVSMYEDYGETTETQITNGYELTIEFPQVNVDESDAVELTADEGNVDVQLGDVSDPAENPYFDTKRYTVEMPGPITDSNASDVDGSVATWDLHNEYVTPLSVQSQLTDDTDADVEAGVESEAEANEDDDQTDETDEDDSRTDETDEDESDSTDDEGADEGDSDTVPGFGVVGAIAALLALIVGRRR